MDGRPASRDHHQRSSPTCGPGPRQTCVIHLIRTTFRLASRRDQDALKHDVKPICTAVNADADRAALEELIQKWSIKHGAVIRLWENA